MQEQSVGSNRLPKAAYYLLCVTFMRSLDSCMTRTLNTLFMRNKLNFKSSEVTLIFQIVDITLLFMEPVGSLLTESIGNKYIFMIISYVRMIASQMLFLYITLPSARSIARKFIIVKLMLSTLMKIIVNSAPFVFQGNQFKVPEQNQALQLFLRIAYVVGNIGVITGYAIGPAVKIAVPCLGEQDCYMLPYAISAILAIIAFIIFLSGTPFYVITQGQQRIAQKIAKCLIYATTKWLKDRHRNPEEHWLDHAKPKFDDSFVEELKTTLRILKVFSVIPLYYAAYVQTNRRWLLQSARLNWTFGTVTLPAEYFHIINPIIALILMPFFEKVLDPLFKRINMDRTFRKMLFGGMMVAIAFFCAGFLETKIIENEPLLPNDGEAQVRVINGFNCSCFISFDGIKGPVEVKPFSKYSYKHIIIYEDRTFLVDVKGKCFKSVQKEIFFENKEAVTIYVKNEEELAVLYVHNEFIEKTDHGLPVLSVIGARPEDSVILTDQHGMKIYSTIQPTGVSGHEIVRTLKRYNELEPMKYEVTLNGVKVSTFELHTGGLYLMTIATHSVILFTITQHNVLHIFWMLPQCFLITCGDVYFNLSLQEYTYSEASISLKVLTAALKSFLIGIGRIILISISNAFPMARDQSFYLFASLLMLNMVYFIKIGRNYKPVHSDMHLI